MTSAITDRVKLSLIEENTQGTVPSNPAFLNMRVTSAALTYNPKTAVSEELRADRQTADLILVGADVSGQFDFEISYGSGLGAWIDKVVEGALFSSWQSKPHKYNATADSSITDAGTTTDTYAVDANGANFKAGHLVRATGFTNSANNQIFKVVSSTGTTVVGSSLSLTAETAPPAGAELQVVGFQGASGDLVAVTSGGNALISTTLDFTTLGLTVGEWVKVGGTAAGDKLATAADNDWCRISVIAAHRLSFDIVPAGWVADAGTGKTLKVWIGDYIRNGTTEHFYTIERQFQDITQYELLTGIEMSQLDFTFDAQSILKASAKVMGFSASFSGSRASGATDVAAPTTTPLNTSSNIGRIAENGAALSTPNYVMAAGISINNNLRLRQAIGSLTPIGIGSGEFGLTGHVNTYFGDATLANKLLNNTATSLDLRAKGPSNEIFLFDLPRVKYSAGAPAVPGKNVDVMLDLSFVGFVHPTLGYSLEIMRFAYTE